MPRAATGLTVDKIRQLAVSGAETLLSQLRAEIGAIERTFPELKAGSRAAQRSIKTVQRRSRRMSAAARKEVSARMKKYWAERRKTKAKAKGK